MMAPISVGQHTLNKYLSSFSSGLVGHGIHLVRRERRPATCEARSAYGASSDSASSSRSGRYSFVSQLKHYGSIAYVHEI